MSRDYYCNFKFKFLKIDFTQNKTYNCHAAKPHPVDFQWLEIGNDLFNTETSMKEREMMLVNERNDSCEQNCWHIEDKGGISPRIWQGGPEKTHTEVITKPEIIDLTISTDCNLTCSYCCKEYSKSWLRDIINNGEYQYTNPDEDLTNRNNVILRDRISLKIKQNKFKDLPNYQELLNQVITYSSDLKELIITGGDPFVDNDLFTLLENINMKDDSVIVVYTGLGYSLSRFKRYIEKLKSLNNKIELRISGDGIGKHLEFNRYGVKWNEFKEKTDWLSTHINDNLSVQFQCTLTNLSIFGFVDFYNMYHDYSNGIRLTFAYTPRNMPVYVLDTQSKVEIENQIQHIDEDFKDKILKSMESNPSENQRIQIGEFIKQFVERREDLSTDIFPKSFLKWAEVI